MSMHYRNKWQLLPVVLLTGLCCGTWAQDAPVAGYVNGTQHLVFSTPLADGTVARRLTFSVTVVTDDPQNPIHLASQDCFATYIYSSDNKPLKGRGFCDGISADGHVWWISLELQSDGTVRWTNLGGVGKFARLSGGGTTSVLAQLPDGKVIARFEGRYAN